MEWFRTYMEAKKFKKVLNLGVFDARDITGWFIDHSDMYENIYLIDDYDFSDTQITKDPIELINIINNKIQEKQNINFIIEDGNLIDYTKMNFDLAILDCDSISAVEKVINEKSNIVFCICSFFNAFYQTNLVLEWIKDKKIYPFLFLKNTNHLFFTADKNKHAIYYEEASNVDFGSFIKYEKFMGNSIVIPRYAKPFYDYQQVKL